VNPRRVGGTEQPSDQPVRRLAMVVCPEREMRDTLEAVRAWAAGNDVMLAGLADDPRLPADCDRRSPEELAAGCDAALALGGDGTMLAACAWPQRTGRPCSASTSGRSAT
jgi:NAD kinase